MTDTESCPDCGGPILNSGGTEVRCLNCGLDFGEFVDLVDNERDPVDETDNEDGFDAVNVEDDSDW